MSGLCGGARVRSVAGSLLSCVILAGTAVSGAAEPARVWGGGPTITLQRPIAGPWMDGAAGKAALAREARIAGRAFGSPRRTHFADELRPSRPSWLSAHSRDAASWTRAKMRQAGPRGDAGPDLLPIICLRVDFQGDSLGSLTSTADGKFDLRPFVDAHGDTVEVPIDPPPHNKAYFEAHLAALDRYYRAQSHGVAGVRSQVFPTASDSCYHLRDTGQYGPWFLFSGTDVYDVAKKFVVDAIRTAAHDPSIPWGDFALPDGSVRVMIFHAGPDTQSDVRGDSPRDIPSFFLTLDDTVHVGDGTHYIDAATVVPESPNQDGEWSALNGVLAHETGHQMGLPDLYNTLSGTPVIGLWSLMDSGNLVAGPTTDRHGNLIYVSGLIPPSLDAWSKAVLWGGTFLRGGFSVSLADSLPAIETTPFIEEVPISATEYFLLENRQTDINGDDSIFVETDSLTHVVLGPKASRAKNAPPLAEYDALLPGSGVLIWHIDEERELQLASLGYSLNVDYARPAVGLMEADGTYDLGDTSVYPYTVGSAYDPYFAGNGDSLTSHTTPSSALNTGADSHISIRVTSPRARKMAFTARSDRLIEGFPTTVALDSVALGSPIVGKFFGDGEIYCALVSEGFLYVVDAHGNPRRHARGQDFFASSDDGTEFLSEVAFGESAYVRSDGAIDNVFAATTRGGRLNVFDTRGAYVLPWANPPLFSTAPSFLGKDILIGSADGRIYKLSLDGTIAALTPSAGAPISSTPRSVEFSASGAMAGPHTFGDIAASARNGKFLILANADGATPTITQIAAVADWETDVTVWQTPGGGLSSGGTPQGYAVGDRHGNVWLIHLSGQTVAGWPRALGDSMQGAPVLADLEGAGAQSVIALGSSGRVMAWTLNGSPKRLWPRDGDVGLGDGGFTAATPLLAPRAGGGAWAILGLGSGNIVPRTGSSSARQVRANDVPDGWPLGVTFGVAATPALGDLNGDGIADILVPANDGVLYALSTGLPMCDRPLAECGWWTMEGGNPARTGSYLAGPPVFEAQTPLLPPPSTELSAPYLAPSPLRLHAGGDVRIGYMLPSGSGQITIDIFDVSGQKVATLAGPHAVGENTAVWQPRDIAPGAYLCKITAAAGGATKVYMQHWAVTP